MIDLNVLNYFLVILGGFGVVWSFRIVAKRSDKTIKEFEYAAFSAIWGIPIFFIFASALKTRIDLLNVALALPMTATPVLFGLGVAIGAIGAEIWLGFQALLIYIGKVK